jgi:hypothetical protein
MTQTDRVIAALRAHPDGICSVDFLLPNVIDGGKPITRLAARILDARELGHIIVKDGERHGTAVYKLVGAPSGHQSPTDAGPAATPPNPEQGLDDLSSGVAAGQLTMAAIFGEAA